MSDRAHMDKPAAAIAVVSGVLIIAASLPFAILALPEQPTEYLVSWQQQQAGAVTVQAGGTTLEASQELHVAGHLSNVTVSIAAGACQDTFDDSQTYGQKPATFTWRLVERMGGNETVVDESDGPMACSDVQPEAWVYARGTHPDIGSLEAMNMTKAQQKLDVSSRPHLDNATYVLTITWSRPAATPITGPLPVPVPNTPATQFQVAMGLAASTWQAGLTEKPEEIK